MFKKALILCLAICMLSVNVFAGTSMLSLASDYSADSTPTTSAEETVTPEVLQVQVNTADSTQSVTYYSADNLTSGQTNTNAAPDGNASRRIWFYMKMPLNGLTTVSAAALEANLKWNTGGTVFYVKELDKDVWSSAASGLSTESNTKTLSGDSLLEVPTIESGVLCTQSKPSEGVVSNSKVCTLSGDALTTYVNSAAASSEYVYFLVFGWHNSSNKDGGATWLNSWELTLTGTKPIEGLSASLIGTKTDTLYFTEASDIAFLKKGTTGNQYTTAQNYKVTTYKGTYNSVDYDLDNILYLRADLSEYMDKEIESIEFVSRHRENKGANKIYIGQTETAWVSDSISYDSKPASVSDGILFGGGTSWNTASVSIKPFLENIGDDGILSLSISANVGATTNDFYGAEIYGVGKSEEGNSPHLVITYKDAIGADEKITDEFTYKVTIGTSGATARLIIGIYDNNKALLDVIASDALTSNGTDALTMDVDLTSYATAAYVKAYLWDGVTLSPYFTPIERAATVTAAQ